MKYHIFNNLLLGLITFMGSHWVSAHEGERVELELESSSTIQAGSTEIEFQLLDTKDHLVLTDEELAVTHEKKLHFFIFDTAFKEFRHEHPEYKASKWSISVALPVNGEYKIWVQGMIASDQEEFSSFTTVKVKNGSTANPLPPALGDVRTGTDGVSKVVLSNAKIIANKMSMLNLKFSRTDGTSPHLTPFLGALAHIVSVFSDGENLVHVHPMDHGTPNQLMVHAVFPKAGDYRLWIQFIDEGALKVVPLSVTVAPR